MLLDIVLIFVKLLINKNILKNNLASPDKVAFTKGKFNNITVWYVFKRFGNRTTCKGNPLIYALKEENNWKFPNQENKEKFFEQVELIIKKFLSMHKPNTIIALPCTNPLDMKFAEMIVKNSPDSELICDVLMKISVERLLDYVYEPDSEFRKYYADDFEIMYRQLEKYIETNIRVNKLYSDTVPFKRHWVEDQIMRNVIDRTMMLNGASYGNSINNKNVLLVDDVISQGNSIRESIRILKEQYEPKRIDVLTLLSRRH